MPMLSTPLMYVHLHNIGGKFLKLEMDFLETLIFVPRSRNHFHSVTYTSLMQTTRGFIILHSRSSIVRLQERNTSLKNRNMSENTASTIQQSTLHLQSDKHFRIQTHLRRPSRGTLLNSVFLFVNRDLKLN